MRDPDERQGDLDRRLQTIAPPIKEDQRPKYRTCGGLSSELGLKIVSEPQARYIYKLSAWNHHFLF